MREDARKMLAAANESEVAAFINQHDCLETEEGKAVVVINGYLSERSIQTRLGDIEVKVLKVRRTRSIEESLLLNRPGAIQLVIKAGLS